LDSPSTRSRFASEGAWPFKLRISQLASCRGFLADRSLTPRVLRIFGSSGTGKSFLVREFMVQAAADGEDGLGLYLDVPPSDLEASDLFDKLDVLLSDRREASRDAPSFVDRKAARAWIAVKRGGSAKWVSYFYLASRELTAQIPLVGPFIKALLPQSSPIKLTAGDSTAPFRFLMRRSRSRRVLLAIDNVQFLPFAVREMLAAELAEAGPHLRLVLIERVRGRSRLEWAPYIAGAELMDVGLESVSSDEVTALVKEVLPEADDFEDIASTIFRRSDGNLKSVWFQLRLVASRREDQEALPTSYEDVILTLPPLDQAVLRFIVFTIGGLTIANLVALLHATDLHLRPDAVINAIGDLATLGLLVVNSESADRVRVEHELVAHVVSEITPEEEKLELRVQAVTALSSVLDGGVTASDEAVLYDRLLGIVNDVELRQTPSLLSHVVQFIQIQSELERHAYLSSICRDSVCWDVLDALPDTTVRSLLDAIQRSALFSFGLVATARLRQSGRSHESLASLYEAKYLVQLFRHDEAATALERVAESKEKRAVEFNIMLNLAQDERAAEISMEVYGEISEATGTEQDYLILRNSGHLFRPDDARVLVQASVDGFQALGRRFGVATALNNLGVVELASGATGAARESFETARRQLTELDSSEVYQPLVNLSAVSLLKGDIGAAEQWLSAARDAAPRSLLQDSAMLDLNVIVLEVCGSDHLRTDIVERMDAVVGAARKIRDLRFLDIVTWFAECLEMALSGEGAPITLPSSRRIEAIRTSGRAAVEVFVPKHVGGLRLEAPFVLSPHWRY
jgi:tetratricopeptide (TPR) repeat protein